MERDEIDQVLLQKIEYEMGFKNGYSYILYSDDSENLSLPSIDNNSFQSMGYYDGFDYGDYCIKVGMRWDIKPDNLVAEMDKRFTHALEKYNQTNKQGMGTKIR